MKRKYLYVVMLDGDICGIQTHELHAFITDNPRSLDQFNDTIYELAREHVSSYIDEDEYEEEFGCEMEVYSSVELYNIKEHTGYIRGNFDTLHEAEGYNNIAQDENGYWFVVTK